MFKFGITLLIAPYGAAIIKTFNLQNNDYNLNFANWLKKFKLTLRHPG